MLQPFFSSGYFPEFSTTLASSQLRLGQIQGLEACVSGVAGFGGFSGSASGFFFLGGCRGGGVVGGSGAFVAFWGEGGGVVAVDFKALY